jgi:DNA invertase Pin-like site-specific DNA recombinase
MPSTSLRSALDALAHSFAAGVLAAIRGASIDDLLAESGGAARRSAGRPARGATNSGSPKAKTTKGRRLARRSAEQVARAVEQVVALVKKNKAGLRSEEIKKALGLDRREVPRILKTAVQAKKLTAKGQKRATVYSVR